MQEVRGPGEPKLWSRRRRRGWGAGSTSGAAPGYCWPASQVRLKVMGQNGSGEDSERKADFV